MDRFVSSRPRRSLSRSGDRPYSQVQQLEIVLIQMRQRTAIGLADVLERVHILITRRSRVPDLPQDPQIDQIGYPRPERLVADVPQPGMCIRQDERFPAAGIPYYRSRETVHGLLDIYRPQFFISLFECRSLASDGRFSFVG